MLKEQNIRCSVIGLAANVHICRKLCSDTQGMITSFPFEAYLYEGQLNHKE